MYILQGCPRIPNHAAARACEKSTLMRNLNENSPASNSDGLGPGLFVLQLHPSQERLVS